MTTNAKKRVSPRKVDVVAEAAKLPPVSGVVVDAITEMLMTEQEMRRPPEKAAALLALIVELYKEGRPFPPRHAAAYKLDCSVYTIDAALSTRLDEEYITQAVETTTGNVAARHGIVRHTYYIPCEELISVVDRAKRRAKRDAKMQQSVDTVS